MSKKKRNKYRKQPPKRSENKVNIPKHHDSEWYEEEDLRDAWEEEEEYESYEESADYEEEREDYPEEGEYEEEYDEASNEDDYSEEDYADDYRESDDYSEEEAEEENYPEDDYAEEEDYPEDSYYEEEVSHKKKKKRKRHGSGHAEDHKGHGKRKKKKLWLIPLILFILLLALVGAAAIYEYSLVYRVAHVEAGVEVDVYDFLKNTDEVAYFAEGSDEIDVHVPGEYHLLIMTGGIPHKSTLYVEDTIAPSFTVQSLNVSYNEPVEASEFVTAVEDATEVTFTFAGEPDFSSFGDKKVTIVGTDLGGNTTSVDTSMYVSAVAVEVVVEAGTKLPGPEDFVLTGGEGEIITDLSEIDLNKVGEHKVQIKLDGETYDSTMKIVDTVAPEFMVDKIDGYENVQYHAEDFVIKCKDATSVKYSFEKDPDYTLIGSQDLVIIATDEGGNTSTKETTLTLKEDNEAPVIEGAVDFSVPPGSAVAYRLNIVVRDNSERDTKLEVDSSKVKINEIGVYPVTYTATDASGNSSSVTINLEVKEQVYDINEVNAMADKLIAKIITPGMTKREECEAIYNYMHGNITYVSDSVKGDYVRSAYEGFSTRTGDCYTYASMVKVLLNRLGIANIDVERANPDAYGLHYWCIVDIDDGHGWYHYDTTPRIGRPNLCLLDDATITAYSDAHGHSHYYDKSLYPAIP